MAAHSATANCCDPLSLSCSLCKESGPLSISDWDAKDEKSIFQMDAISTDNQNQLWNQMLLSGSEGACHMEGNLYDMRASEMFQLSGDFVIKNEDEEPAPCWEFSNLSSFEGEGLTLSNPQKQTFNPFPSNLMESHRSYSNDNYAISDMKNWCSTDPKHSVQRLTQLKLSNLPMDYTLRSGLDFPMTNFDLGISNINDEVKCFPLSHETHNNIDGLGSRKRQLKSNSTSTGDDTGRPFYTGTVLAVEGYNVNPFRWQVSSLTLNKPGSYFPATKSQSQHQQRTTGKAQYRHSKNTMNTKKRTTDTCHEAIFKRPRLDNSLPSKATFGERIAALQQLVSPFGKTDAASVLSVTIEYIKVLHEQVQVLSAPYMNPKGFSQGDHKCWGLCDMKKKETKGGRQDLRSKGLCVLPLSCTPQLSMENTIAATVGDYRGPGIGDGI